MSIWEWWDRQCTLTHHFFVFSSTNTTEAIPDGLLCLCGMAVSEKGRIRCW